MFLSSTQTEQRDKKKSQVKALAAVVGAPAGADVVTSMAAIAAEIKELRVRRKKK